jgi:hypothetical protein
MAGVGEFILGSLPVLGGALLGATAGRGGEGRERRERVDFVRSLIKADQEILERVSPEETELRADLERSINGRLRALLTMGERNRTAMRAVASHVGTWRDALLFVCALIFTVAWWNLEREGALRLPLLVVLIALSVISGYYTVSGLRSRLAELRGD